MVLGPFGLRVTATKRSRDERRRVVLDRRVGKVEPHEEHLRVIRIAGCLGVHVVSLRLGSLAAIWNGCS